MYKDDLCIVLTLQHFQNCLVGSMRLTVATSPTFMLVKTFSTCVYCMLYGMLYICNM